MFSRHLFSKTILAIAISQAALSGIAIAEESTVLDELKIEGRAITELDQEITAQDIEKNQASSLEDLFRNTSEVTAGGTTNIGQKIYVRNIGEDSLNITVDGAEQAGGVFHHAGRITIEPELLKRVEVEAGAANATSGPGALGGSVRFVTKDASDLLDNDQNVGALLKSTFSSNGGGIKNSITAYGRTESGKTEGLVHINSSNNDNYDDGNGDELRGTDLDENLGFAKIKTQLTEEQDLSLSYESLNKAGDMPYKPELAVNDLSGNLENNVSPSESERETITLNYNFTDLESDLIDSQVTVYQTKSYLGATSALYGFSEGYVETAGITLQNTSLIENHELTYGLNYRDDESNFNNGSNVETGNVTGLYIQDNINISDQLTISTGVRYDQYKVESVADESVSEGGFSPNIGAVFQFTDHLNIAANYSQAVRGPEIRDSFKLDSGITYSDDITVETATNTEMSINYNKDSLAINAGVYESVIDGAIGLEDSNGYEVPWGGIYDNYEQAIKTTGFYLDITYQLEKLTAGLHYHSAETTHNDMTVTRYSHSSTANSIGDTLVLSLDYQVSNSFEGGWSVEIVKGINNIDQSFTYLSSGVETTETVRVDKPGYVVHNIYAKWLPLKDDQLTISLTINNLFDEQYLSHAAVEDYTAYSGYDAIIGQAASGRDIRLSAALKF
ncbi:hypothetical protein MUS1_08630 [Marinomonas ushuaiensis DSM 15871]|uniref:TonB-dependent receptor n=1 Tax=Marinomonas ushuaiensis DSM 15871 TaxID=1122207 RepID=X7E0W7_9GAMM|nr:TonB-dependent receptor [Marinomonas ushuaiensis]ETX09480.1 hypothetical protein MUS1_08630 [Marinomonas ushuaiensis DSM 15871]